MKNEFSRRSALKLMGGSAAGLALGGTAGFVSAQAKTSIATVVKIGGIPWFNAMEVGIKKAGEELGVDASMIGPTQADAAQQVRAVEDLIARNITSPEHLGIQGGSNGGLLVGNMAVMYPQLFGAVVCQVPLLDMKRYHKLLAGASWMAEYGDPDSDDWRFIQTFSPYQNVKEHIDYPPVLFTTSTRDDRVHPGHARKMMARMMEQGHDVTYYENIEGGHGGAANNAQSAYMSALAYTFLKQKLFPGD